MPVADLLPELRWRGMAQIVSDGLEATARPRSHPRLRGHRSDRPVAPRGPPRPGLPADPPAALRRRPGGARRRRHGHDRRPVRHERRAQPAGRRGPGSQPRGRARAAGALPGLHPRAARRRPAGQPGLAGRVPPAGLPARDRQALHGRGDAGEGVRPAAAGRRPVVRRVRLPDAPGDRLPGPPPRPRRRPADGRLGPVGQHRRRDGPHPPGRGAGGGGRGRPSSACAARSCSTCRARRWARRPRAPCSWTPR